MQVAIPMPVSKSAADQVHPLALLRQISQLFATVRVCELCHLAAVARTGTDAAGIAVGVGRSVSYGSAAGKRGCFGRRHRGRAGSCGQTLQ